MNLFKSVVEMPDSINIKAIAVSLSASQITIQANTNYLNIPTKLRITRDKTPVLRDVELSTPMKEEVKTQHYSVFLGILTFKEYECNYLVMGSHVEQVATLRNHPIYLIKKVQMIPIVIEQTQNILTPQKPVDNYLNQIAAVTTYIDDISAPSRDQYLWNQYLMRPLASNPSVDSRWCVQLIQGFVKQFSTKPISDTELIRFTLITRRSAARGGTRYSHRGVDNHGNASNFCESEQIVEFKDKLAAHRQIRGSVPLLWGQSGFQANLSLFGTAEENEAAFRSHFDRLRTEYKQILCVNLMSQMKEHEVKLTEKYEAILKKQTSNFIRYEFFDFHHACKGFNYASVNEITERLKPYTNSFIFYAVNTTTDQVVFRQGGILRTNCLDCLDRTNVFMTKIGASGVEHMLTFLNQGFLKEFGKSFLDQIDNSTTDKNMHKFMVNFKTAWADNGDYISRIYAGTGATTSKATKEGQIGFLGLIDQGIKGIERFYQGNFEDAFKQSCINILLGTSKEFSYTGTEGFNTFELIQSTNGAPSPVAEFGSGAAASLKATAITTTTSAIAPPTLRLMVISQDGENPVVNEIPTLEAKNEQPDIIIVMMQNIKEPQIEAWYKTIECSFSKQGLFSLIGCHCNSDLFIAAYFNHMSTNNVLSTPTFSFTGLQVEAVSFDAIALVMKQSEENGISMCFVNCRLKDRTQPVEESLVKKHLREVYEQLEEIDFRFIIGQIIPEMTRKQSQSEQEIDFLYTKETQSKLEHHESLMKSQQKLVLQQQKMQKTKKCSGIIVSQLLAVQQSQEDTQPMGPSLWHINLTVSQQSRLRQSSVGSPTQRNNNNNIYTLQTEESENSADMSISVIVPDDIDEDANSNEKNSLNAESLKQQILDDQDCWSSDGNGSIHQYQQQGHSSSTRRMRRKMSSFELCYPEGKANLDLASGLSVIKEEFGGSLSNHEPKEHSLPSFQPRPIPIDSQPKQS